MALAGSFIPQSIGISNEFEQKSIIVAPENDPTNEETKTSYPMPKVSFMEQVAPYISANQELTTLNVKNWIVAGGDSNDGKAHICNNISGEETIVAQDFNIPVFKNKQYNNFSFSIIGQGDDAQSFNSYACPHYLSIICFNENGKKSYMMHIGGDQNLMKYLKVYYISKNYIVFKCSDSYQNGNAIFLNKNEMLSLVENNNMFIQTPTSNLHNYIEMSFPPANSNYCYLAPLNGIDQIFQHVPKEVYYEALGTKRNEVVRKDGIDYLFFGKDGDNNHQDLAFSAKAIDLED